MELTDRQWAAVLEADKRGILPPEKQAALAEARRRGLVPGSEKPASAKREITPQEAGIQGAVGDVVAGVQAIPGAASALARGAPIPALYSIGKRLITGKSEQTPEQSKKDVKNLLEASNLLNTPYILGGGLLGTGSQILGASPETASKIRTGTEILGPLATGGITMAAKRLAPEAWAAVSSRASAVMPEARDVLNIITGRSRRVSERAAARIFSNEEKAAAKALHGQFGEQYAAVRTAGMDIPVKTDEIADALSSVVPKDQVEKILATPTEARLAKASRIAENLDAAEEAALEQGTVPQSVYSKLFRDRGAPSSDWRELGIDPKTAEKDITELVKSGKARNIQDAMQQLKEAQIAKYGNPHAGNLISLRQDLKDLQRKAKPFSQGWRQLQDAQENVLNLIKSKSETLASNLQKVDREYGRRMIKSMGELDKVAAEDPSRLVKELSSIEDPVTLAEARRFMSDKAKLAVRDVWMREGLAKPENLVKQMDYWSKNNRTALDLFAGTKDQQQLLRNLAVNIEKEAKSTAGFGRGRFGFFQGVLGAKDIVMGALLQNPAYLALGAMHVATYLGYHDPKMLTKVISTGGAGIVNAFISRPTTQTLRALTAAMNKAEESEAQENARSK